MMLLVKAMSIQACHPCQKNIYKNYAKINYKDENNCLPISDAARLSSECLGYLTRTDQNRCYMLSSSWLQND